MHKKNPAYTRLSRTHLRSSLPLLRLLDSLGELSQVDAAKRLSVTPGACNLHCQRLERVGLVRRARTVSSGGKGRPTIFWDIDHEHNAFLTFVFDGPTFHAALLDFTGHPLLEERFDLSRARNRRGVESAIETFADAAVSLAGRNNIHLRRVVGVFPGLIDPADGSARMAVNAPMLDGINIATLFSRHKLPAWSASLTLCSFFGETAGQPSDTTTLLVHWDLGVGVVCGRGDTVLSVQLARNGVPELPEVGHICIEQNGRPCLCGRNGCLEAYTGGQAMIAELKSPDIRSLGTLIGALQTGHKDVLAVARRASRTLGRNLTWPVQLMAAKRIVISGPLSSVFDKLSHTFHKGLYESLPPALASTLAVHVSPDPQTRLRIGAFRLAKRHLLDPDSIARLPRSPAQLN